MKTDFKTARVRPTGAAQFVLNDGTKVAEVFGSGEMKLEAVLLSVRETDELVAWIRSL